MKKLKLKIIKKLITRNGFYDREVLVAYMHRSLFSVLYCTMYRKFLKSFVNKN